MNQGIRSLPKPKAERTEAVINEKKPSSVITSPEVKDTKENSSNGEHKNGAGTVFMTIGVCCALGAAYYYFYGQGA